jgi:hypothetical protein
MMVMRQEGESFLRAAMAFSTFQTLLGLKPPPSLVTDVESEMAAVRADAPPRGESQILDEMARGIAAEVAARDTDNDVQAEALGESVMHAWHTFSGGAHGYVWPDSVPGDFISSLGVVVPVAHWAVDLALRRTRV